MLNYFSVSSYYLFPYINVSWELRNPVPEVFHLLCLLTVSQFLLEVAGWRVLLPSQWGQLYDCIDSASAPLIIKGSSWKAQDSLHHPGCQQKPTEMNLGTVHYRNELQMRPKVGIAYESMSNFNQWRKFIRLCKQGHGIKYLEQLIYSQRDTSLLNDSFLFKHRKSYVLKKLPELVSRIDFSPLHRLY